MPVEVKSGNTAISYTWDGKGRKKSYAIDGVQQATYSYTDYSKNGNVIKYSVPKQTYADGTVIETERTGIVAPYMSCRLSSQKFFRIHNSTCDVPEKVHGRRLVLPMRCKRFSRLSHCGRRNDAALSGVLFIVEPPVCGCGLHRFANCQNKVNILNTKSSILRYNLSILRQKYCTWLHIA